MSRKEQKKTYHLVAKALEARTKNKVDDPNRKPMSSDEVSAVVQTTKRELGNALKKTKSVLTMKEDKEHVKNNDSYDATKVTQSQLVKADQSAVQDPKAKLEETQQKLNDLAARIKKLKEVGVKRMHAEDPLNKGAYGNAKPGMAANDPAVMPKGSGVVDSIERAGRNAVAGAANYIKNLGGGTAEAKPLSTPTPTAKPATLQKDIGGPMNPPIPDSVIDPKNDPRREPQDTYAEHRKHADADSTKRRKPEVLAEFNDEGGPFHVLVATHPDHHHMIGAHHRPERMVSREQSTWPNSVMDAIEHARNQGFDRLIIHQPDQEHAMEDRRQKIVANNGSQKTPLKIVKSEDNVDHHTKAAEHLEKAKYYHKMMKASRLESVANEWKKRKDFHMAKCQEHMQKCMAMSEAKPQGEQSLEKASPVMTVDHKGNKEAKPKKTVQPQETSPKEDRERNEKFKAQQEKNRKALGEALKLDAIEVVKQNKGRDPGTGFSSDGAKKSTKNLDKFKAGEQTNAAPEGKRIE